jgi:hypothetical protein
VLLLSAAMALSGCGYSFTGQAADQEGVVSRLAPELRKMALVRVENPTIEAWLEPRLRSLIRDEFTRRRLVTWTDKAKATALLTVIIKKFARQTALAGQQEQSVKLSTTLTLIYRLQNAATGAVIWDSGEQEQTESYYPGDAAGADQRVTDLAVRRMADLMTQNY